MSQIISFSLYGDEPLYCEGALRNLELAESVYPGWRCRFYLDDSVPARYVTALKAGGAEVIHTTKKLGPMYGRYWRFWVAADPAVERFIVRDADSRLNAREKAAVDAWIISGKSFHIMRETRGHHTRMLAGMWGGVGGKLPDIAELIDGWGQYDRWGQCDQFVSQIVFPLLGRDYLCHDDFNHFEDSQRFPPHERLRYTRFIGEKVPVDLSDGISTDELRHRLMQAEEECQSLRREKELFLGSNSWKITAPLRTIRAVLTQGGLFKRRAS